MIFKKLKELFIQRKFEKKLRLSSKNRVYNTNKIRSVGIITTDEFLSNSDIEKRLYNVMENVKTFHIYSYRKLSKSGNYFTKKNINWKGEISDINLKSFLDNPFDLLIGYFNEKHLYLEFVTLKSKATFKIGFAGVNDKLFDLVIAEKIENDISFTNEIRKYLESLSKV